MKFKAFGMREILNPMASSVFVPGLMGIDVMRHRRHSLPVGAGALKMAEV